MKKQLIIIIASLLMVTACKEGSKKINLNQEASFTAADTLSENPLLEKVLTGTLRLHRGFLPTLRPRRVLPSLGRAHVRKTSRENPFCFVCFNG